MGAHDSLIVVKIWNIFLFLLLSFSEISNGHCLLSVAFSTLIAHSVMPYSKVNLIMHIQSPVNFLVSSSFLPLCSGFFDSGSSNTIMFLLLFSLSVFPLSLSFSNFLMMSTTILFSGTSMILYSTNSSFHTFVFYQMFFHSFFQSFYSSATFSFFWIVTSMDFIFRYSSLGTSYTS